MGYSLLFHLYFYFELTRCLHKSGGVLQVEPGLACQTVMACAVLHNIAIRARLPPPAIEDEDADDDEEQADKAQAPAAQDGIRARRLLVTRFA